MRVEARWVAAVMASFAIPAYAGLTQDQFREDLRYVVGQLPALHPNLFFSVSSSAFYAAANQIDADIPQLSTEQFYTRLNGLVAMVNDPHTYIWLDEPAAVALGFTPLPVQFRIFADGIFVIAAPPDRLDLNQARLVHVNGVAASDVLTLLTPQLAHDNDSGLRANFPSLLGNAGVLRGIGVAPPTGPIPFGFELKTGEQVTVALSSDGSTPAPALDAARGYMPPALDHSGENYWSAYWPYANTVYIRYAQCVEMPSRPVTRFTADTLALVDYNAVDTLVVDLRGNSGGIDSVTMPLVIGLVQRIKKLRANPRFRAYTLIDGGVFSSGLGTAMNLKLAIIPSNMGILGLPGSPGVAATLAGEPTGGKPGDYGAVRGFRLPQSNLYLQYSTMAFPILAGIPARDALYPDVPVNALSTDYFARHDPVLAAVLGQASNLPVPPSGRATVVNAASFRYETGIAPGSFASAFGAFPAGDLNLTVNGAPAQVLAAVPSQVNFVIPVGTPPGQASLEVRLGADLVSEGQFQVTAASPGLFIADASDRAQPGSVLNADGALNAPAAPAPRGSVLTVFATGYESLDPADVSAWIANRPAEIISSGLGFGVPGLWAIEIRVPDDPVITNQVPLFISTLGMVSNGVTIFTTDPK